MDVKKYTFTIDGTSHEFESDQDVMYGDEGVILDKDIDLMQDYSDGFSICKLNKSKSDQLVKALQEFLKTEISNKTGINVDNLEDYHLAVNDEVHEKFIKEFSKGFKVSSLKELKFLDDEISKITSTDVSTKSPYDGTNYFWMRIIRPGILENNPAHKDVYLDYLRNGVNIYFPICGSTKKSSLSIAPKTHKEDEQNILRTISGAKVGNRQFTVPAILHINGSLELTRPNPQSDEMMVFSPYLVHGAGINEENDMTRISLEMRFWPKNLVITTC
jgi:hypothetical protein